MAIKLLTVTQVARLLGVTPRTLRSYVADGKIIPPSRIGRPRWDADRLAAWLADGSPDPKTWRYRQQPKPL